MSTTHHLKKEIYLGNKLTVFHNTELSLMFTGKLDIHDFRLYSSCFNTAELLSLDDVETLMTLITQEQASYEESFVNNIKRDSSGRE